MEMDATWLEDCISGYLSMPCGKGYACRAWRVLLPACLDTGFRQKMRGKCEEPANCDADLYIGQEQKYFSAFSGFRRTKGPFDNLCKMLRVGKNCASVPC